MRKEIFLIIAFLPALLLLSGCGGTDGGGTNGNGTGDNCKAKQGEVFCGYCPEENKCTYCATGYTCPADPCNMTCNAIKGDTDGTDNTGDNCQAQQGLVYCGYCTEENKCSYCPAGNTCPANPCDTTCKAAQGGGGGGTTTTTYYASCSGCTFGPYGTYSYRGASYGTCNAYYQTCVQARCGKILDNCR